MTRRERIIVLLENYVHVVNGMKDHRGGERIGHFMCDAWNRPRLGYPELEYLRKILKDENFTLYRHLDERYLSESLTKRVKMCPRCEGTFDFWHTKSFHRHGHNSTALVTRMVRITPPWVRQDLIECKPHKDREGKLVYCGACAVCWLDEHWAEPGPFLPRELQVEKVEAAA